MSEQSVHPQEFEDVLVLVSRMITGHVHVADDAGMRERLTPLLVRLAMSGTAYRHCMMLDCMESLDLIGAYTGEVPAPGWVQSTALGGYLCPNHAWVWEGHFPQWVRHEFSPGGQLTCPCSWVSGAVSHRGLGKELWKSHAFGVVEDRDVERAMRMRSRGRVEEDVDTWSDEPNSGKV